MPAAADPGRIEIRKLDVQAMQVPIIGTAPLIVHNWSEKAKRQMLDAQQGRKTEKQHRDPEADYRTSLYRNDEGGYGFPAVGFKKATVSAARFYGKAVRMTELRQFIFFKGEFSKIENQELFAIVGEPEMREDMVTVGISGTDLRYRAMFREWSMVLNVLYVASSLSQDSVLSLLDAAGTGVGVGEWRPEKSGSMGTFEIDTTRDVKTVKA